MMRAPVVLFVYNRPEHSLQTLEALHACEQANETTLYIYSDGPKANATESERNLIVKVRDVIRSKKWCGQVHIIESEYNKGLATSVINGVTAVLDEHDCVIVLEDDIIVSQYFLRFMNDALEIYKNDAQIAGISGFCYTENNERIDNHLLPIACSWSWAIWKRTWSFFNPNGAELLNQIKQLGKAKAFDFGNYPFFKMLQDQVNGKVDSWAIRFYASIFLKNLYFVYPKTSLVSNIGFGEQSTHTKEKIDIFQKQASSISLNVKKIGIEQSKAIIRKTELSFQKKFTASTEYISMKKRIKSYLRKVVPAPVDPSPLIQRMEHANITKHEQLLLQNGKLLANAQHTWNVKKISDAEFQVFSQWGDDGIIQYLIKKVEPESSFIEFGVEDYKESNTRFLLHNNNFKGLVIDGSSKHIQKIKQSNEYWKFDLTAVHSFITAENINEIFESNGFVGHIGILSIDIDGNDYWVWKAINSVKADIVIVEYNSVFGAERTITVPYDPKFVRANAHHSLLYAGTSLAALCQLANEKGYSFVGSNSAGNNAYFVNNDKMAPLRALSCQEGYVASKFRESRDVNGNLTYLSGPDRQTLIKGMPIYNTTTNQIESL